LAQIRTGVNARCTMVVVSNFPDHASRERGPIR
jgi:hypothetical protein